MSLLDRIQRPVVGAPMAGGVSSPLLVAAVSDAGGLGMLAAGYRTPEQVAADIVHTRDLTTAPFGINLFVPQRVDRATHESAVEAYREAVVSMASRYGATPGHPSWHDTDHWEAKATLVQTLAPAVISCTFGIPDPEIIAAWQQAGSEVHITVTSLAEAQAASQAGADALIVQGQEAGGHRGSHDPNVEPERIDHLGLLELISPVLTTPLIAAGGVTTAGDVQRAQAAGARAVQIGTALLLATESGASPTYRRALRDPALDQRCITRAFSGRSAGALRNAFVEELDELAPPAYPILDQISRPVRTAAAQAGDVQYIHAWAGTGWRACEERPAAQIVAALG